MALVVTGLSNHPGMWLRTDAAASIERFEDDHGVFDINSAGRSHATQLELLARWAKGGAANRPPNLYQPALHSPHEDGIAVDSDTPLRLANYPDYGWYRNLPTSDPVHLVYDPARDKFKNRPAGGGGTPISPEKEKSDMTQYMHADGREDASVGEFGYYPYGSSTEYAATERDFFGGGTVTTRQYDVLRQAALNRRNSLIFDVTQSVLAALGSSTNEAINAAVKQLRADLNYLHAESPDSLKAIHADVKAIKPGNTTVTADLKPLLDAISTLPEDVVAALKEAL